MLVTINLTMEELGLVVAGLQCGACISEDNGHKEQAKTFRELWQKLEEIGK